ncbi:MAG: imidazole glycerol phosphate synthase subunit HisH [Robiginitomaculum sp.]|nr:MAG: imidazole glycerol phosphate synthase subunit HisH [Robiginitomaculum sp.]
MSVVIVDTGCANLASVGFAIERLGSSNLITRDVEVIRSAERVLLPGVGAAPSAMQNLREFGLIDCLQELTQPVLGICLGMQILFMRSEEGACGGLGLIKGNVTQLETAQFPSPHMGWNTLHDLADDPLLHGINDGDYSYFVHSYAVPVNQYTLAKTNYGTPFSAMVRKENIWGCQFHPERSGQIGAQILANFLQVRS